MVNLPNLLTIGRLFATPLVIWLIATGEHLAAFWVFALAGATDAVDGALARALDQRTKLGAYLDAVADKALLVSIYVTLALAGEIPAALAAAVVARDALIVGAVGLGWALQRPLPIEPLKISKANTAAQIVFAGLVLGGDGFGLRFGMLEAAVGWVVAGLTLASAGAYLLAFAKHMARAETGRRDP
ncbi:CDP-alcohol phosphatidyltransferase family protein [Methylopila turkensis]|uniref:CDP-diacylglycerol--glycerol-3-phosphate 3-phosphatidyltransferase n=1 Tax=Methylopila turkensis TaxID=1437816 RepID=A0A9W6JRL9_9HYPH|nr:CDP-alcohol phosphatidyltransferase family protein [Methylopila turkensis]GLK80765.1 CDP-diacylglycerol--glycerol-3-phosphate 3-phosphatidyltransferase [Methylopila turkensis]